MSAARKNRKSSEERKERARKFNQRTANERLAAPFVPHKKGFHIEKGQLVENRNE